ncbi:amino acid adenylation domain-containing protein [Chitinophaga pendula]|uniref:non-ribosomal peptide synthetase n=1 Tax=Chitinophaga TaxID=79328 RepID=UPI0018E057F9|nr:MULTISPECIES: non-ribosomal peptide synthetase [Chitinophaga]UCJ07593.1 amino acid adenylation domain-containing protein [Chitinophaga pendula]
MNNVASPNKKIQNIYELTPLQEGILFHTLYQSSGSYIVQTWYTLRGKLDVQILKQSLDVLFMRHEALRTAIVFEKVKQPLQVVMAERQIDFRYEDLRGELPSARPVHIDACLKADREKGFHLTRDSLLRLTVCQEEKEEFRFLWTFHHILMDGWCVEILSNELEHIYFALYSNQQVKLSPPKPYSHYIKWLRQHQAVADTGFWKKYLEGCNKPTGIPRYLLNEQKGMRHREISVDLPAEQVSQLQQLVRRQQVTLNVFMQTLWGILLGKMNGAHDAIFGIITSGRPENLEGVDQMIGLFINTIPLRVSTTDTDSFASVMARIQQHTRDLLLHQHDSLAEIQAIAGADTSLIDHVLIFENYPLAKELETATETRDEGFVISNVAFYDYTHYDFSIVIMPDASSVTIKFEFNELVYDTAYITAVAEGYMSLLEQVLSNPQVALQELCLPVPRQVVATPLWSTDAGTMADVIRIQSRLTPAATALVAGTDTYSYKWLETAAESLADYLLYEKQVTAGERVAVLAGRTVWSVVAMLGIWKAGAVYVPIDQHYPAERQLWMIKDAGINLILTTQPAITWADTYDCLHLHATASCLNRVVSGQLPAVASHQAAYIIYTSGSTGRPKGVIISHVSLAQLIAALKEAMVHQADWQYLLLSPLSFDASLKNILVPLSIGATLHLIEDSRDIPGLGKYISAHGIHAMHTAPAVWEELLHHIPAAQLSSLCCISSGGEAMSRRLAQSLLSCFTGKNIYNTYGPTEITINATVHRVTEQTLLFNTPPIGKPLSGYEVYILNDRKEPQPAGISGEICIGGTGLAMGYVQEEDAAGRYINGLPSLTQRLYRTGDKGVRLPDGEIIFQGRLDDQIKIRGYRIDPVEIDQHLIRFPGVQQVFTTGLKDTGADNYLVTYYTTNAPVERTALRQFLERHLPGFMIPATFVEVPLLALDINGKINRKQLPDPRKEHFFSRKVYVAPATKTEQQLTDIWQRLLGIAEIGTGDNFFEIGGHSLKATRLMTAIQSEMGTTIRLKDIFEYPTIGQLAAHIREADTGKALPAITTAPTQDYYALSHAQRRIWVLCQFKEDNAAYNMPYAAVIRGALQPAVMEAAITLLMNRHESLRTVFISVNGIPYQQIRVDMPAPILFEDLTGLDEAERQQQAAHLFEQDAESPFDIERGPLFQFHLLKMKETEYLLIVVIHHIISDGWSQGILGNELITIYNSLHSGLTPVLPAIPVQYKDYSHWHNALIEAGHFSDQEHYWLDKLKDKPNGIVLPADFSRQSVQTFNGKRITFSLGTTVTESLNRISSEQQATLYMTLMSIVNIFLYKYTGQQDIILGLPIAARKREELHGTIGFMVNTIIFRLLLQPDDKFPDFLQQVKKELLESYEHQDYPFDMLVEKLDMERNLSQSPLFNVMVAYNNTDLTEDDLELTDTVSYEYEQADDFNMSKFDLIFFIQQGITDVVVSLEYNSDLFEEATAARMANNFRHLCEKICLLPNLALRQLNVVRPEEEQQLVQTFNDTYKDYGAQNIIDLFEVAALQYADREAVRFGKVSVSYRVLNEQANRLAHHLIDKEGVRPGDIIGLALERSVNMIITLIAIVKTGAAYVAIDPGYPVERIRYMIQDSGVSILFADRQEMMLEQGYDGKIILVEEAMAHCHTAPDSNPTPDIDPESSLYIIYTSGSTGTPNGAVLSHGLLANLIIWQLQDSGIDPGLSCLQFTSVNFCVSFQEIFSTLCSGGLLHLIGEVERQDIEYLAGFLSQHAIEVLYLPFSYLNFLFNEPDSALHSHHFSLRHIITAGEQLKITTGLRRFLTKYPHIKLHNHYGSSEMHVVSYYTMDVNTLDDKAVPPAGKPVGNTAIYILDESKNIVPVGTWGEVCISGSYEVKGYLNNAALTAARLFDHPLYSKNSHRLYCSGDIGRRLADGNIEIKGRKDGQIKIRGFRVEPGEVETVIFSYRHTKDAVVVVKEDGRGQFVLLAYVVLLGGSIQELKEYISGTLPGYMVPRFIQLEVLPLMPNGKVDRAALPEPPESELVTRFVAPRNEKESRLTVLWKDILGVTTVGVLDNFFELGGHSLKATRLVSSIYQSFGQKLELINVFKNPTIEALAALLQEDGIGAPQRLPAAPRQEFYPVTPEQHRLWLMEQLNNTGTAYNMPLMAKISGELDYDRLLAALIALMRDQEILRTAIVRVDGTPVQQILSMEQVKCPLDFHDLHLLPEKDATREKLTRELFDTRFDLTTAPLFNSRLIRTESHTYFLLINLHHIIGDADSCALLLDEWQQRYNQGVTDKITTTTYKDYAYHLAQKIATGDTSGHAYWLRQLDGQLPLLEIPVDFSRPVRRSFAGTKQQHVFSAQSWEALRLLARQQHCSQFALLMTLVKVLLHKYSGQTDLVVGGVVSDRTNSDMEQLIGLFLNTLPFRTKLSGIAPFTTLLQDVNHTVLEGMEHAWYPVDRVMDELQIQAQPGRLPLFDVVISYEDLQHTVAACATGGLHIDLVPLESDTSKFDLAFHFEASSEGLLLTLAYNTGIFSSERMARLLLHFDHLVAQIIADPAQQVNTLGILTSGEQQQILEVFNTPDISAPSGTLVEAWMQTLNKHAGAQALVSGFKQYTYQMLHDQATRIAACLQEQYEVKPGDIVGVMTGKSFLYVAALLAIIRTGAAYLPIDPDYPEERIRTVFHRSGAALLLMDEATAYSTGALPAVRQVQLEEAALYEGRLTPVDRQPESITYVIYTSGSSGQPKGVPVTDAALLKLCSWSSNTFGMDEHTKAVLYAGIGFDAGVWELWPVLLAGGKLFIPDERIRMNIPALQRFLVDKKISHCFLPTPVFEVLCRQEDNQGLSDTLFLTGGDKLKYYNRNLRAYNNYGPAEAAVVATAYSLQDYREGMEHIPIGRPLPHHRVYILDDGQRLLPVGMTGEIAIGGPYITNGYLDEPALNERHFVPDPYYPGQRLYLTGDRGYWQEDGNIIFDGRKDDQLKIRGKRITLGEIEQSLQRHPDIHTCVVRPFPGSSGEISLVAYIVSPAGDQTSVYSAYLRQWLPAYMIPAHFIYLEQLPLTPNGKVDYSTLPLPVFTTMQTDDTAPVSSTEATLLEIWRQIFNNNGLSVRDNFFELGGHSLTAINIVAAIARRLSVEIDLALIFAHPTVAMLAAVMPASLTVSVPEQVLPATEEAFPLSYAQQRLWAASQLDMTGTAFLVPLAFNLDGIVDSNRLQQAFDKVVQQHESLRTVFVSNDDQVQQQVWPVERSSCQLLLEEMYYSSEEERAAFIREETAREASTPFTLLAGPLCRAKLITLEATSHLLLITLHHLIVDGLSCEVLLHDLVAQYLEDLPVTERQLQYRDFVHWESQRNDDTAAAYWQARFRGYRGALQLRTDFQATALPTYDGKKIHRIIHDDLPFRIKEMGAGVTGFQHFFACLNILLYRYTGQQDIVIGVPFTGRDHTAWKCIIGFFVNMLPLRTDFSSCDRFDQLLELVKADMVATFRHQYFPLDKILQQQIGQQETTALVPYRVGFTWHPDLQELPVDKLPFRIDSYDVPLADAKADLWFHAGMDNGQTAITLEYNTALFEEATACLLADCFVEIITQTLQQPCIRFEELKLSMSPHLQARRSISDFNI